jgi:myosin-crossreactive antigen
MTDNLMTDNLEICVWKYSFKKATFEHYTKSNLPHKCKECSGYEIKKELLCC